MASITESLNHALELHQAGRLDEAEKLYRGILQADDRQSPAWHFLGVLCGQRDRHDLACKYLSRAVELEPGNAVCRCNLGHALRSLGRLPEAAESYRWAIRIQPNYPAAHYDLGITLHELKADDEAIASYETVLALDPRHASACNNLGELLRLTNRPLEAERCFRRAMEISPLDAEPHLNLGVLFENQERFEEAETQYLEAIRLKPEVAEAHSNLGFIFKRREQFEEAERCYRRALEISPRNPLFLCNLGAALLGQKRLDEAEPLYREALRLQPGLSEAHSDLGTLLMQQGRVEEGVASCRAAVAWQPDNAEAHHKLGVALMNQGDSAESLAAYAQALDLRPDYVEAHVCRSLVRLLTEDFAQGWPEYEWRWKLPHTAPQSFPQPQWDGSPLAGRTILLYAEQGLGDTLHCIRYAPLVKARGGRVLLGCQPPLVPLLGRSPGVDRVLIPGERLPDFDVCLPMLGLPGVFQTTLDNIPAQVPYLFPDPQLAEQWRSELGGSGLKVGIAWCGNPRHPNDHFRSFSFERFAPLASLPGVQLYSLQIGAGREQLDTSIGQTPTIDLADRLEDFDATAAVVSNLDLVISCDSALVHLAGGLGVETWIALAYAPDWRWLRNREDSPWYPTARLFRQRRLGDWSDVFARLEQRLCDKTKW